jgi:hypothetical protein
MPPLRKLMKSTSVKFTAWSVVPIATLMSHGTSHSKSLCCWFQQIRSCSRISCRVLDILDYCGCGCHNKVELAAWMFFCGRHVNFSGADKCAMVECCTAIN